MQMEQLIFIAEDGFPPELKIKWNEYENKCKNVVYHLIQFDLRFLASFLREL